MLKILFLCTMFLAIMPSASPEQSPYSSGFVLLVRVLNAKTGKPIAAEKISVAIRAIPDALEYKTDSTGYVQVRVSPDTEVMATTEWWHTCKPIYPYLDPRNYVQSHEIVRSGVVLPNTCGKARSEAREGELVIFARKATFFETWRVSAQLNYT